MVIMGVVSPEDRAHSETTLELAPDYQPPTLKMSQEYYSSLDDHFRRRLRVEIVADRTKDLPPLETRHLIEGLVMGKAPV